jgi:hypothetical protein
MVLSIVHPRGVRSVTYPPNPNESQPSSGGLPQQLNPYTRPYQQQPPPIRAALPIIGVRLRHMPPKQEQGMAIASTIKGLA